MFISINMQICLLACLDALNSWLNSFFTDSKDFCASDPCENGGTCDNTRTGFLCECGRIDGIIYGGPTCGERE